MRFCQKDRDRSRGRFSTDKGLQKDVKYGNQQSFLSLIAEQTIISHILLLGVLNQFSVGLGFTAQRDRDKH
jgi:hypothetical protein